MYTTIRTLFEKGFNKSEIAKMTKHDWKTVAKVIKNNGIPPKRKPHPCKLDPYREEILKLMEMDLNHTCPVKITKKREPP